jgi:Cu/Zn superoxide dismutase
MACFHHPNCLVDLRIVSGNGANSIWEFKDIEGRDVGKAALIETPQGVLIRLSIKSLPAGNLAFHVHTVGACEPPFLTAGPHFNPAIKKHGLEVGGAGA